MPPLGTFTSQSILSMLGSCTNKFESAAPTPIMNNTVLLLMCKKSLWSSFLLFITGCDRIYTYKSAILPVPTEMYRIELNEFIVLYSPLESEAMKMWLRRHWTQLTLIPDDDTLMWQVNECDGKVGGRFQKDRNEKWGCTPGVEIFNIWSTGGTHV
jgi:hypothetical protein